MNHLDKSIFTNDVSSKTFVINAEIADRLSHRIKESRGPNYSEFLQDPKILQRKNNYPELISKSAKCFNMMGNGQLFMKNA
jgi:hypothetical protein